MCYLSLANLVSFFILSVKTLLRKEIPVGPHFQSMITCGIGRLNDYMRRNMADGFSQAESSNILGKHNLHGQNVVVGVGDTGLDVMSTYFYDENHSVRYKKGTLDKNHRKVALYYPLVNKQDDTSEGHGTHVCGILAGKALKQSAATYNVSE